MTAVSCLCQNWHHIDADLNITSKWLKVTYTQCRYVPAFKNNAMERLLSAQDLADMTGLALQTIYNRHSNGGSLPTCLLMGRLLRFRQSDVEAWLETLSERSCMQSATPERLEQRPRSRGRPTKAEEVARRMVQRN